MIGLGPLLKHYKRKEIQQAIVDSAGDREIAVKFGEKGFGKRPDILKYPSEVFELVKQGATSFHISEERWSNPLDIVTGSERKNLDELRTGWDLIIDIDCPFIEYSKQAADLVIKALRFQGVKSISCKFSGNKGFHIGVPFEAFPLKINNTEVSNLFPESPRRIALYLTEMIKEPLSEKILELENGSIAEISKKTGLSVQDITRYETNGFGDKIARLDVEPFLEIDTILIASRHLYRSVYSFNEKSGLVSIPVDPDKVLGFKKDDAQPDKVEVGNMMWLDTSSARPNEAEKLFTQAFDFKPEISKEDYFPKNEREFEIPEEAIPEQFFPPCIQNILKGLPDGKKRALFILGNFLSNCGWGHDQIKALVDDWNKKNPEKLKENIITGSLRYRKGKKAVLPPNCSNSMYYKDMRICTPDNLCQRIRNPVNYARRKSGQ